jgi:hypothetical protein
MFSNVQVGGWNPFSKMPIEIEKESRTYFE